MRGEIFIKSIIWNWFVKKIPGHPRKSRLGKLRSWIGGKLILSSHRTSIFAPMVDMRGFAVKIGEDSGIGYKCLVMPGSSFIEIGNRVTMGPRVMLICNLHRFREVNDQWVEERLSRPIVIGNECFIGAGAIILGGVAVGRRSIVAAGSVVTKDVPEGSFVAGQPAKRIRSTKQEG